MSAGGQAKVYGKTYAYFLSKPRQAEVCQAGMALQYTGVDVRRVGPADAAFAFADAWDPTVVGPGVRYQVSTNADSPKKGVLDSTKGGGQY